MLTYTSVASHLLIKKEDKITKIKKTHTGKTEAGHSLGFLSYSQVQR